MSLNLSEIRERLDELRSVAESEILDLYSRLENGKIDVREWQTAMDGLVETFS